jgi:flavin-dependent dehydrogenase
MAPVEALILGGGPAGATAARLLSQWGYSVALATGPAPRHSMAECLPPSTRKIFRFLGIEEAVAHAGFLQTTGNTVWWGGTGRRVEPYPEGSGYQVARREFDRLLLRLAESAGARILAPAAPRPKAAFVLDCSGRAGVLARQYRITPRNSRTVALCGVWRSPEGWRLPDAGHTLVEAYPDGWAWSVPLSPGERHVAFMVDPAETRLARGKGLAPLYLAELAKTRAFRRIFAKASLCGAPWGRDASPYTSRQFCGPGFLLAGDAGSCIDPLSSFGVKKALVSGWTGAVTANTYLRRPGMRETALRFFEERERQMYEGYRKQASGWSRAVSAEEKQPFWGSRGEFAEPAAPGSLDQPSIDPARVRASFEDLRASPAIRLRRGDGVTVTPRAGVAGSEVVLRDALAGPGAAAAFDFIANVEVCRLLEIAPHHRQVPDLFEAYNRTAPPVDLADFLTALSSLLAEGILVSV